MYHFVVWKKCDKQADTPFIRQNEWIIQRWCFLFSCTCDHKWMTPKVYLFWSLKYTPPLSTCSFSSGLDVVQTSPFWSQMKAEGTEWVHCTDDKTPSCKPSIGGRISSAQGNLRGNRVSFSPLFSPLAVAICLSRMEVTYFTFGFGAIIWRDLRA